MYTQFATVYDRLMADVDYSKWADYYESIFEKFNLSPSLVLDIGCGTGSLTTILADRGYDMIGLDGSEEMLGIAKEKNGDILYINMDAEDFELYGTVDAVVSSLDLLNYVEDTDGFFRLINNYLNYGGIFVFDISTPYKLENVLGNNTFVYDEEDIFYAWDNSFDGKCCDMILNIFVKDGERYDRIDEYQTQRAVTPDEIIASAQKAGLEILGVYDEFSFDAPRADSERIFFAVRRKMQ
ncbi:MAG: class I SAM-dependent methyltransferase [Clostridia bacterium]|nr:class I SAM-dependent methyltransferase [Clostridia bacterium]